MVVIKYFFLLYLLIYSAKDSDYIAYSSNTTSHFPRGGKNRSLLTISAAIPRQWILWQASRQGRYQQGTGKRLGGRSRYQRGAAAAQLSPTKRCSLSQTPPIGGMHSEGILFFSLPLL
ncbi:hypothetical protein TNCT_517941 [Trichonephila clavata]|uniref:Secreted protein n=1 Tax=Trichonephila clavata TaxID=2740835 RepID=A0A8X6KJT2_TRICU|nr:hypothetical protein TNCT_517941 [Trichonephila clavata]